MPFLHEHEFLELTELVEYAMKLDDKVLLEKWMARTVSKEEYYKGYAKILGIKSWRTVQNTLFVSTDRSKRELSENGLGGLSKIHKRIIESNKKKPSEEKEEFIARYKALVDTLTNRGKAELEEARSADNETGNPTSKELNSFSEGSCIGHLHDTTWYCFERHQYKEDEWIERKIFRFGKFTKSKKSCEVTLQPAKPDYTDWEGVTEFVNEDESITIRLTNKATKNSYLHFMLRIDKDHPKPTMLVGHKTFRNPEKKNIVSKTVLLERVDIGNGVSPSTTRFEFSDEGLDVNIRKFFSSRGLNRLSSPHKVLISCIEDLKEFHCQNDAEESNRKSKFIGSTSLIGHYSLYYRTKPTNKKFVKDEIELAPNEFGGIDATYTHRVKSQTLIWRGSGIPNNSTHILNIYLVGPMKMNPVTKKEDVLNKPMFLMIDIPPIDVDNIDTLSGLIAGSRDFDRGSVARLMVMTKVNLPVKTDAIKKFDLSDYFDFYSDRSWVRPPSSTIIFQFNDLEIAIQKTGKQRKESKQREKVDKDQQM